MKYINLFYVQYQQFYDACLISPSLSNLICLDDQYCVVQNLSQRLLQKETYQMYLDFPGEISCVWFVCLSMHTEQKWIRTNNTERALVSLVHGFIGLLSVRCHNMLNAGTLHCPNGISLNVTSNLTTRRHFHKFYPVVGRGNALSTYLER